LAAWVEAVAAWDARLAALLDVLAALLDVLAASHDVLTGLLDVLAALLDVLAGLLDVLAASRDVLAALRDVLAGLLDVLAASLAALAALGARLAASRGASARLPVPPAANVGYTAVMPYTKQDLIEQSGLPDRTIRNYIKRGLLPPPVGYGLGAEYGEEHMIRAVAIGRMRAQGDPIDVISERVSGWTIAKFKRFVRETDPAPAADPPPAGDPPPAAPAPPAAERPAVEGEHVARAHLTAAESPADLALPDGPSFRIVSLLPGLVLMLDTGAAPVVRRIAAEICERYGQR
jgi:DNA-binding transcriptional MerR regulator